MFATPLASGRCVAFWRRSAGNNDGPRHAAAEPVPVSRQRVLLLRLHEVAALVSAAIKRERTQREEMLTERHAARRRRSGRHSITHIEHKACREYASCAAKVSVCRLLRA